MATPKQFVRLNTIDPLVKELKSGTESGKHEWWGALVKRSLKDPSLNIQVRGDYLSVYCRMGSLLTIRLDEKKEVICSIHYKYLIASRRKEEEYVDVTPSGKDLTVNLKSCDLVTSILDDENFKRIKSNIARLAGEEKSIQSKLVEQNRKTLLDAEIAFSESGTPSGTPTDPEADKTSSRGSRIDTRIDLVNYDRNRKALVFIELKQVFDDRLYSDSKGFKEVNEQIAKYGAFAKGHEDELIKAYNDVIEVKVELGLLPEDSVLKSAKIERVEPKPILAIAAYSQDIIDAMKGKVKEGLNVGGLAALYFFGATPINLNLAQDTNKELFI